MNAERRIQGWLDPPLDEWGRAQAAVARRLAGHPVEAVYSSDLRRAQETAQVLADLLGRPLVLDPRLRERNLGPISGLTIEEIRQRFPEVVRTWEANRADFPGGELSAAFWGRVTAAFADIVAAHPQGEVAVVTYGGTLAVYLASLLGLQPDWRIPLRLDNGSLSILEIEDGRPRIRAVNDCCHLEGVG
jgi:broad specificity phosphatase PhoE